MYEILERLSTSQILGLSNYDVMSLIDINSSLLYFDEYIFVVLTGNKVSLFAYDKYLQNILFEHVLSLNDNLLKVEFIKKKSDNTYKINGIKCLNNNSQNSNIFFTYLFRVSFHLGIDYISLENAGYITHNISYKVKINNIINRINGFDITTLYFLVMSGQSLYEKFGFHPIDEELDIANKIKSEINKIAELKNIFKDCSKDIDLGTFFVYQFETNKENLFKGLELAKKYPKDFVISKIEFSQRLHCSREYKKV